MKRQVADRLFLTGLSLTVVCVAFFEPRSIGRYMLDTHGVLARAYMLALGVMALIALADTVVNDMLPERFTLTWPLGRRRGIWMAMAVIYALLLFVVTRADLGWSLMSYYALLAWRCAAVSYLDLFYQFAPVLKPGSDGGSTTLAGALRDE